MNNFEQNAEILSSFGLTVKQAKVYLALVSKGTAPVGEISKLSNVRREEVYRILPKLEKMGLIQKTLSIPVKLKATSVDNALSILIRNEEEKAKTRIAEMGLKRAEFLDHFRASSKEGKLGNAEQFTLLSEKAVALSKVEEFIDNATFEIDYCVSREKLLQFLKFFSRSLSGAVERGVKICVLSKPPKAEDVVPGLMNQVFSSVKSVAVRYLENIPNHFLVMDSHEVLVATSTEGYLGDSALLWSNNIPHVRVYEKLFEYLWDSSVESLSLNLQSEDEKVVSFVKQMKPGSHVILLYERSDGKLRVLLNYIKYALENSEAAVYICSEASVEEVKDAMQFFGIDVKKYLRSGALKVLDYTEYYMVDGRFDVKDALRLSESYYKEAVSKGFAGLRLASETACFFKHNIVKDLVDFERALHETFDIPMFAMYAYRADDVMRSSSSVNVYPELAKGHGNVLFTWADKDLGRIAIS